VTLATAGGVGGWHAENVEGTHASVESADSDGTSVRWCDKKLRPPAHLGGYELRDLGAFTPVGAPFLFGYSLSNFLTSHAIRTSLGPAMQPTQCSRKIMGEQGRHVMAMSPLRLLLIIGLVCVASLVIYTALAL
jgi:hypothetical protein